MGKMQDKITIRNAREQDLNEIVELENEIWPEGTRATRDKFESRLKIFQQGFFLAYKNGKIIGASTSEKIDYYPSNPPTSWEKITDNGYIRATYSPEGNAIYVVSIGAKSRSGGGSALVQEQKKLVEKLSLKYLVLGARIPGYDDYIAKNRDIPIEEYVQLKREDGELFDSELRFYTRNGLALIKILPNYMEDDKESRNYGAIMVWKNQNQEIQNQNP